LTNILNYVKLLIILKEVCAMEKLFKSMSEALSLTRKLEGERKSERGFTLVELLVVVAIIAILAAIAIPQFAKYRKQAAAAGLQADARNCVTDAISQITQAQMTGATVATTGNYSNISPNTQNCTWNYNATVASTDCTCNGSNVLSGVRCWAISAGTGTTVQCSGL
jgi:type IV pilus assembly protein PilA